MPKLGKWLSKACFFYPIHARVLFLCICLKYEKKFSIVYQLIKFIFRVIIFYDPFVPITKKKTSAQTDYLFGNWAQKSNTFENWTQNDYIFWKLGIKILYIWKLDTKILYIWKLGTKNYTFENWAQKDYIFKKLGTKKYLFWKLVINILNMSYHKSLCNSLFRRLEVRWKSSATFITAFYRR